jgi:hypothetical protein
MGMVHWRKKKKKKKKIRIVLMRRKIRQDVNWISEGDQDAKLFLENRIATFRSQVKFWLRVEDDTPSLLKNSRGERRPVAGSQV